MSNKLIYVADDDADVLEIYKNIFSGETGLSFFEEKAEEGNFSLKYFGDGEYLWTEIQEDYNQGRKIPLCILDMRMPLMNGYKTAQQIRKLDPDVIFIFVSAYSDISVDTIRENLKQDIYHIRKPFNQEELYSLVDSLIKSWNQKMMLRQQNEHLESVVEKRTMDYRLANEALKIEIAEKEKSQKEALQLQQQLYQASKMEAMGTLAGGIAHDFNNILGVIMGYSELSFLKITEPELLKGYLEKILQGCEHAKELVKRILIFSRKSGEDPKSIDIIKTVREVMELIRASLPSCIEIQKSFEISFGNILGNATEIQQILMNLSANAAYAMKEKGGILKIQLREAKIDEEDLETYLELVVSDTGQGMSKDVQEHLFEPYFSTKPVGEGTGFGLSVVHGIVKKLRGEIRVESELGKGTKFHLFFPRLEKNITQKIHSEQTFFKGEGKFLVVDDEIELANLSKEILEWLGYKSDVFTDSQKALSAFSSNPKVYDFVLTDHTMPGISGCSLAKAIMQIRPDLPIILCSGYGESISQETIESSGIKAFIPKPIAIKELSDAISKISKKEYSLL